MFQHKTTKQSKRHQGIVNKCVLKIEDIENKPGVAKHFQYYLYIMYICPKHDSQSLSTYIIKYFLDLSVGSANIGKL